MPHPAILKELNMTSQDWGRISSEEERSKLKEKAATALLAKQGKSVHERLASAEERLGKLEANANAGKTGGNTP